MYRKHALVELHALPDLFAHRVAKASELIALGLNSTTVYANCRQGGPWQRLLPGVMLLSNSPPTRPQLVQAALRYAGPDAVLTGHDTLRLHGMRGAKPIGPVHLLIPHARQVRSADRVIIERTTRLPQPQSRDGFPVAPIARAVLDTARRTPSVDGVRAIFAEAVQRGFVRPTQLQAELAGGSNRGTALARRVLSEISAGVRSVAEAWARRLVLGSRLPKPVWNVPLCDQDGQLLGIVDAWWDDAALAWEIDSHEWHPSPSSYDATLERDSRLTAAGITVVHTAPGRLRRQPVAVLRELELALAHARGRARPRIVAG